jgi:hypothetical protein
MVTSFLVRILPAGASPLNLPQDHGAAKARSWHQSNVAGLPERLR